MGKKLSSAQRVFLSAFIPAYIALLIIFAINYFSEGEIMSSANLRLLFWPMAATAAIAFFGFLITTVWPSKADRRKARARKRKRKAQALRTKNEEQPRIRIPEPFIGSSGE